MGSRLINVRLDEERVRKAQRLRERGVTLSELVREAIDHRYGASETLSPADVRAVVAEIHGAHPDPPGLKRRAYAVHDAKAARAAIRRRVRARTR